MRHLKKSLSHLLPKASKKERYRMMTQQTYKGCKVEKVAKILGISRSGYYRFAKGEVGLRQQEKRRIVMEIEKIHIQSRQTYGSPRVHAELKGQGEICSRPRAYEESWNQSKDAKAV